MWVACVRVCARTLAHERLPVCHVWHQFCSVHDHCLHFVPPFYEKGAFQPRNSDCVFVSSFFFHIFICSVRVWCFQMVVMCVFCFLFMYFACMCIFFSCLYNLIVHFCVRLGFARSGAVPVSQGYSRQGQECHFWMVRLWLWTRRGECVTDR